MAENGINNYLVNKHYEPAPVLSLTEHEANNAVLFVSDKVWSSLTDEQKKWVQAAADDMSKGAGRGLQAGDSEARAKLEKIGVKVVKTVDKTGFATISKPIQDKLANDLGPQRGQGSRPGAQRQVGSARGGPCSAAAPSSRSAAPPEMARARSALEQVLMILCGVAITGFSVAGDVRHRHPHHRPPLAVAAGSRR